MRKTFYVISGLNSKIRAAALKGALYTVPKIISVKTDIYNSILEIRYKGRNPEDYVSMACKIVGRLYLQSRIKKRDLRNAILLFE